MSLILKGIDLPKEGKVHRIVVFPNGKIALDFKTYIEEYPAIQIPKGARLIDANAMLKDLNRRLEETNNIYKGEEMDLVISEIVKQCQIDSEIRTLKEWISKQPTILESEEEE